MESIGFLEDKAWCPFCALDPNHGLVAVSALTTSQEIGLRIAARLIGGIAVALADGTVLKRQKEIEIPLPQDDDVEDDEKATRYKVAYTRTHPLKLVTGVGYETCVLHRDATMQAAPDHWGYLLRLPGSASDSDAHFRARFFHLWGRVTGLPARPAWCRSLWTVGLNLGLIVPLQAFGCEGWRIDPRCARPDGLTGWGEVLKTLVLTEEANDANR
jgi:hypothetical protein